MNMKMLRVILLAVVTGMVLFSCQKEVSIDSTTGGGTTSSDLSGTWKFLYLHTKTNQVVEATDGFTKEKIISRKRILYKKQCGYING